MFEIIKAIGPAVTAGIILGMVLLIMLKLLFRHFRRRRWSGRKFKRKDYTRPIIYTVKTQGQPCLLFFDTETTGLAKDIHAPASPGDNWPRLVQLSWIKTDLEGKEIGRHDHIVEPDGFKIPRAARKIHGISTRKAIDEGEPLEDVLKMFAEDAGECCLCIGHNVQFDKKVVVSEYMRIGVKDPISFMPSADTMKASVQYCRIPGRDGRYKWPTLQQLYKKLFGRRFKGAHDSMKDVTATKECFFELIRQNVICIVRDRQ